MHIRGFHHVAIQVRDVERCAAWYRDVLGLPEQARFHLAQGGVRSVWMTVPGGFLALERTETLPVATAFRDGRPGPHLVALRIDRSARDATVAELRGKGVTIEHETQWTVYVRDPEGNRIGLSHHPEHRGS